MRVTGSAAGESSLSLPFQVRPGNAFSVTLKAPARSNASRWFSGTATTTSVSPERARRAMEVHLESLMENISATQHINPEYFEERP